MDTVSVIAQTARDTGLDTVAIITIALKYLIDIVVKFYRERKK